MFSGTPVGGRIHGKTSGGIVKIEKRFQFILSSLAAGCFAGWCFFELGGIFSFADDADPPRTILIPETYVLDIETDFAVGTPGHKSIFGKKSFLEEKTTQAKRLTKIQPEGEDLTLYQAAAQNFLLNPQAAEPGSGDTKAHLPENAVATASLEHIASTAPSENIAGMGPSENVAGILPPGKAVFAHTAPSMGSAVSDTLTETPLNGSANLSANSTGSGSDSGHSSRALIRVSEISEKNTESKNASFVSSTDEISANTVPAGDSAVALLTPQDGVSVSQRMAGLNQMAIQNLMRSGETKSVGEAGSAEETWSEMNAGMNTGMNAGISPEIKTETAIGQETKAGPAFQAQTNQDPAPTYSKNQPEQYLEGQSPQFSVHETVVLQNSPNVPGPEVPQTSDPKPVPSKEIASAEAENEIPGVVHLSDEETFSEAKNASEKFLADLKADAAREKEETSVRIQSAEIPSREAEYAESANVEKSEELILEPADESAETLAKKQEAEVDESADAAETKAAKYALSFTDTDIRDALEKFAWKTDLKVFAALDVQGEITCETENSDPEILLSEMLTGLPFGFVRHEDFIYVAHTSRLKDLPEPLNEYMEQVFVPRHISIEELELALSANLSSVGSHERTRDLQGNEALCVKDWVVSLDQLVEIQKLIDLPAPEHRMTAFVFQHELNGTAESLDLVSVAENRGLVLQRMAIPSRQKKNEKKSLFGKENEGTQDIQAYSISFRTDTFMIGVRDQMHVLPATLSSEPSAKIALNEPMEFEFMLNVAQKMIPFHLSLAFRENPNAQAEGESQVLAEVVCQPKGELDSKSKPKPVHFTMPMPTEGEKSLVFQLNLGEFAHEDPEMKKNPIYAFRGNRIEKEAVIVFMPFKERKDPPQVNIAPAGVKALVRQQEVLGRKYFGSLNQMERELSPVCFSLAQKLRQGTEVRTEY